MRTILVFTISCFVALLDSCNINPPAFDSCEERPLTNREKKFLEKLEEDSIYKVSISRFDYNYRPNYGKFCENHEGIYQISSFNTPISLFRDSVKLNEYAKYLTLHIYNRLLDDSLKYYTPKIEIEFYHFDRSKESPKGARYHALILKDDIERYNGWKFVSGKYGLKRIQIKKVSELKICTKECNGDPYWVVYPKD